MSGRATCSAIKPFSIVIGMACKASIKSEIAKANADPTISVSDTLIEDKSSIGPSHSWMISQRPPPCATAIIIDASAESTKLKPITKTIRHSITMRIDVGVESVISKAASLSLP